MWSNWGMKGSSCFIVCHHLELSRSGSKECCDDSQCRLWHQAGLCLSAQSMSFWDTASVYASVKVWMMTVPTNYCCLNRICGGFAMWQLGLLNSTSQNSLSLCFWLERAPTEIPRKICKVQVSCRCSHAFLLTCWLAWLAGGSDQTSNGSALCWILLWLLWPLGQVCLFSSRTDPGFYRVLTTKIRNKLTWWPSSLIDWL